MKKLFLLLTAVLMTVACALAQTRVVTGTVVSAADDEPLGADKEPRPTSTVTSRLPSPRVFPSSTCPM